MAKYLGKATTELLHKVVNLPLFFWYLLIKVKVNCSKRHCAISENAQANMQNEVLWFCIAAVVGARVREVGGQLCC